MAAEALLILPFLYMADNCRTGSARDSTIAITRNSITLNRFILKKYYI